MTRLRLILAAVAAVVAIMATTAAPAVADEFWGFDDPWSLEDPNANSDDVEFLSLWDGVPYLVELEPEQVDGEWTWVADDFEPAWDEFGWGAW